MANLDLQSLKYVVDTIGTEDMNAVQSALTNHVHHYNIDQAVWLRALRYAERRIEVIEAEVLDQADRVLELVDIMPHHRGSEAANIAAAAKTKGKRAQSSDSLQAAFTEDIAKHLVCAIIEMQRKETVRENLKNVLLRWVKEARDQDLFR